MRHKQKPTLKNRLRAIENLREAVNDIWAVKKSVKDSTVKTKCVRAIVRIGMAADSI